MEIITLDSTISAVNFNNTSVTEVQFNGIKVWPLSPTPIGDFDVRLTLINATTEVHTYSDGVIPYNAFSGRTDIVKVEIGDGITTIGHNSFDHCESLSSVTFGSGVTTFTQSLFGSMAFSCCYSLTNIELPLNISVVPKYLLIECTSLTSVTIPSGVTTVDGGAFSSCWSLSSITCYAVNAPELPNPYTFADMPSEGILNVPQGSDYSSWIGTSATSGDKLGSGWTIEYIPVEYNIFGQVLMYDNNTSSLMASQSSWSTTEYPLSRYTPIGINIYPSNESQDGKARFISLVWGDMNNSSGTTSQNNYCWGENGTGITSSDETLMNGKSNTLIALSKSNHRAENTQAAFTAFYCASIFKTLGTNQGNWFIPSYKELEKLSANKSYIDNIMQEIVNADSSKYALMDTHFWTSTETSWNSLRTHTILGSSGSMSNNTRRASGPKTRLMLAL